MFSKFRCLQLLSKKNTHTKKKTKQSQASMTVCSLTSGQCDSPKYVINNCVCSNICKGKLLSFLKTHKHQLPAVCQLIYTNPLSALTVLHRSGSVGLVLPPRKPQSLALYCACVGTKHMQQFGQVSVTSALWSLRKQEPEIAKASDELTNQFRALKSTSVEPCMVVHT